MMKKNQQDDYLEDLKIKGDANAEIGNYEKAIKITMKHCKLTLNFLSF